MLLRTDAIGNIGKNAESVTIGGKNYASFSIGVTIGEKTSWVEVLKLDKDGKLTPHLTKGKRVYVTGLPTASAYISKQSGNAIPKFSIWANELVFLSGGNKEENKNNIPEPNNGIPEPNQQDEPPF